MHRWQRSGVGSDRVLATILRGSGVKLEDLAYLPIRRRHGRPQKEVIRLALTGIDEPVSLFVDADQSAGEPGCGGGLGDLLRFHMVNNSIRAPRAIEARSAGLVC